MDKDLLDLLNFMGASKSEIYKTVKIKSAIPNLFAGLRIAATYSMMSAVVSEWLGAEAGLGFYLERVRKTYKLELVFATIIVIVVLSIFLNFVVNVMEKKFFPWSNKEGE